MISKVKGELVQVNEQSALVNNGGICYELSLPSALAERLQSNQQIGKEISFETIYYIEAGDRKSSHFPRLVGFSNVIDREFFSLFTQVPGMGIKKALKSLIFPIREIAIAIEQKNAATLSRMPGIGARLAEKIIAELHGKTTKFALSKDEEPLARPDRVRVPLAEEALEVLIQLQYSRREAEEMIARIIKQNPDIDSVEDLITEIFKSEQQPKELPV